MTKPIIIFSDHPASFSGLGRITRDIATRIHQHLGDEFRVATLGHGAPGSSKLPFPQYQWAQRDDFLPLELPFVWKDFCGDDDGILMTIGDIQRYLPLADTQFSQDMAFAQWMPEMRKRGKLKLWGYFPIDAHDKDGKLGPQLAHTLTHYDRILVPSNWAAAIVRKTLPNVNVDVLPHGIDTAVFKPYEKKDSQDFIGELLAPALQWPRQAVEVDEKALWVGIVATNQGRKDWGLGIETLAELKKTQPVFLWAHTDRLKMEWPILELLSDFGLLGCSMVTVGNLPDEVMAVAYSACDVTLGIGRGEGFGYPIFESWSCGVPCIAGSYGAHAEYIPKDCRVAPSQMRIEGALNLIRPVFKVQDWVNAIHGVKGDGMTLNGFDWNFLWKQYAEWFRKGLQ